MPPFRWSKFWGGFSMPKTLVTNQINECQQCKNEHPEGHKIMEIKMIFVHQHHLHPM
jgi:hypothetical protein